MIYNIRRGRIGAKDVINVVLLALAVKLLIGHSAIEAVTDSSSHSGVFMSSDYRERDGASEG